MQYDFNNLDTLLENGYDVEDICNAFTRCINEALENKRHKEERDKILDGACEDLVMSWNEVVYQCQDATDWLDDDDIRDFIIDEEYGKRLVSFLLKGGSYKEQVRSLVKVINEGTNTSSQTQKIETNPINGDAQDFTQVITKFLNDMGLIT